MRNTLATIIRTIINLFNEIRNNIINVFTILVKTITNRFNQDCLGKRLYRNITNGLFNFKLPYFRGRSDILPLIAIFFATSYLTLIFSLSLLDLLSVNVY